MFGSRLIKASAMVVVLAATSLAQTRTGGETRSLGNQYLGADRTTTVSATSTARKARAKLKTKLVGDFLKKRATIASVTIKGKARSGATIKVRVAGLTVYSTTIGGGSASIPIIQITVWSAQKTLLNAGIVRVDLTASAGGGAQFSASFGARVSPPSVDLSAAYQVYGNATGGVTLKVISGSVASVGVELGANFFNTTLRGTLPVYPGLGGLSVWLDTIWGELKLKLKWKLLWLIKGSKTFASYAFGSSSKRLL